MKFILFLLVIVHSTTFGAQVGSLSPINQRFLDYVEEGAASDSLSNDLVSLLKDHPEVNINAKTGEGGKTALFIAVESGNQSLVNLLLKYGADPRIPTAGDITPLEIAQKKDYTFIASALEETLKKYKEQKGAAQSIFQAEDKIQDAISTLQQGVAKLQEALNSIISEINALPINKFKKKELVENMQKVANGFGLAGGAGYFGFQK